MRLKRIIVPNGVVTKMVKEGLATAPTIRRALMGDIPTLPAAKDKAMKIRQRALNLGGAEKINR